MHESEKLHISRFGVIPKSNQPGKWILILDLSSPEGFSVNDSIDPHVCSMSYATVDQAVSKVMELGRNALMAKVDIEHAYRNVPVHVEDRSLLGMSWQGKVFVDTVLPFGLGSAPMQDLFLTIGCTRMDPVQARDILFPALSG